MDAVDGYYDNDEIEDQASSGKRNGKMNSTLGDWVKGMCDVGLSLTWCGIIHVQQKDQNIENATNCRADPNRHSHSRDGIEDVQIKDEKRKLDKP